MSQPTNRLARLPLRSKLSLLASVPLVGMMVLSSLVVVQAGQNRAAAVEQRAELSRVELTSKLVLAVLDERDAFFSTLSQPAQIDTASERTDGAATNLLMLEDLAPDRRLAIEELLERIRSIRERLAGDPSDSNPTSDRDGRARSVYEAFNAAVDDLIAELGPDTAHLDDASAMIDITTVQVMTNLNDSIRTELLGYVAIGLAGRPEAAEALRLRAVQNGGRSLMLEQATLEMANPRFQQRFDQLLSGQNYQLIVELRQRISGASIDDVFAPSPALLPAFEPLFADLAELQNEVLDDVSVASERRAQQALIQLLGTLLGALIFLGLVAFLVGVLFRAIRTPLSDLTDRSRRVAQTQLPAVVATIRELGGDAPVEMPEPIPCETDDEIGELVDAFNQLHRTAVELAAGQASSRRTVSEMFVNLGRRNQKLLMRLLSSLEQLERNERDPEALQELFKVDHLATRMRRNAESLLVLAGARTSRAFNDPVPVGDVARSALSEVEDYERVTIDDDSHAVIDGKVVADLGHLLAELVENALQFSPPGTPVEVICRAGPDGLVLAVGDRGIGLTAEELRTNNERIRRAAELTETPSRFLGLYVVGRLASRHRIGVELHAGVPSGLIARVVLPGDLYDLPAELSDEAVPIRSEGAADPPCPEPAPPATGAATRRTDPPPPRSPVGPPPPSHRAPVRGSGTDLASPPGGPAVPPLPVRGSGPNLAARRPVGERRRRPQPPASDAGLRTAPAAEGALRVPPDERRPGPDEFTPQRRVPGASGLGQHRRSPGPPDAGELSPGPADGAARFGSSMAGFQRGVRRADTAGRAPDADVDAPSSALDPSGDQS